MMDVIVCAPNTPLFTAPVNALADALHVCGCRVAYVTGLGAPESGRPDLVILSHDQSVARARQCYPGARVFQIGLTACGALASAYQRLRRGHPDYHAALLPKNKLPRLELVEGGRAREQKQLIAMPRIDNHKPQVPVWLHAMPKDIPTVLVFSALLPDLLGAPFNLVCFAPNQDGATASNTYFKDLSLLPAATAFAQVAVVNEDAARALDMLRNGLPVVFSTLLPEAPFARALRAHRLGVVVKPRQAEISAALRKVSRSRRFAARAQAYAKQMDAATSATGWAEWLCKKPASMRPSYATSPILQPNLG